VFKTLITYLDEPKQQLRTKQAKHDHVFTAAAIRQWHRQWRVFCPFSSVFRTHYNLQMDKKSGEFGWHSWGEIISGVSFLMNQW